MTGTKYWIFIKTVQDKLNTESNFSSEAELSFYVHVPFCAKPCAYCKFYKKIPSTQDMEDYISCIEAEAAQFFLQNPEIKFKSIFFGGGTPTSLRPEQLERLCKIFDGKANGAEWTIEASPSTFSEKKAQVLKSLGVNRISLGIQSFDENTLKVLGRSHSASAGLKALDLALNAFDNVNLDLIFGSQNQSQKDWEADLDKATSYPLQHISAYCLEYESGTSACAGVTKAIAEQEKEVDFLNLTISKLAAKGFKHYEISNYAKENFECTQNLNTWQMGQWIGFGPSAASQFKGRRFKNPSNLETWAKSVQSKMPKYDDIVILDDTEMLECALIFGLRMREGVNLENLKNRFPNADFISYNRKLQSLIEEGILIKENENLKIADHSIALADAIAVELL